MFPNHKSLRLKFNTSTYVIILVTLVFNVAFYLYVHRALVTLTDQLIAKVVHNGADLVGSMLAQKRVEIDVLADFNMLSDEAVPVDAKLAYLSDYQKKNNAMLRLFLADKGGDAVSTDGDRMNFKEYAFFGNALNGSASLSEPIYSYQTRTWVIATGAPIINVANETVGALIAFYDLTELEKIVGAVDLGPGTTSFITSTGGVVIAANSPEVIEAVSSAGTIPESQTDAESLRELQYQAIERQVGTGEYMFDGNVKFAIFDQIDNSDWILVSTIPENELYKSINYLMYNITVVTLVIALVAIYFSLRSGRLDKNLAVEKTKMGLVIDRANMFAISLDANHRVVDANQNFRRCAGYSKHDFSTLAFTDIIPDNYQTDFALAVRKISDGSGVTELDIPVITKDGAMVYIVWNSNNTEEYDAKSAKTIDLVGINITEIKEYENKIQRLAFFDRLTGLNNVTYLSEYVNAYTVTETDKKMAFIYLDIDNFKYINDMFGHDVGDTFIVDMCSRVVAIDNPKVKVSRHGGDELAMVYEDIETDLELKEYLDELLREFRREYYINNVKISVSASIGISFYPFDGNTYGELFKAADIALNKAKEMGKGRIQFFTNEMKNEIYEIIMLESELRSAIDNDEFVLYFQPQFEIESGRLCGFEALIRWINPRRGFVPPGKFIPQAEKNQLIIPIGDWVLEKACDFLNEIIALGYTDIDISVNVSVVQLMCEDYVEKVIQTLDAKRINPSNIKLEITESVMMESIEDIMQKINYLNIKGVFFSLDDFGTGYSSLTYLKKIPIKVLKIDKSFVDMITDQDSDKEILSSIIGLAHKIDLDVIAEGIEENSQLEWLRTKGCNFAQGFFMGKPMPRESALKELGKNMYQ